MRRIRTNPTIVTPYRNVRARGSRGPGIRLLPAYKGKKILFSDRTHAVVYCYKYTNTRAHLTTHDAKPETLSKRQSVVSVTRTINHLGTAAAAGIAVK